MNNPMSAAEFWWNHLTHEQREFLLNWFQVKTAKINTIEAAYEVSHIWSFQQGWPETPQSTFTGV